MNNNKKSATGESRCLLLDRTCTDTLETIASFLDFSDHGPLSQTCKLLRIFTKQYRASGRWYTSACIHRTWEPLTRSPRPPWDCQSELASTAHEMAASLVALPKKYAGFVRDVAHAVESIRECGVWEGSAPLNLLVHLVEVLCRHGGDNPLDGWDTDDLECLHQALQYVIECEYEYVGGYYHAVTINKLRALTRAVFLTSSPGALRLERQLVDASAHCEYPDDFARSATTPGAAIDMDENLYDSNITIRRGGAISMSAQAYALKSAKAHLFAWDYIMIFVVEDLSVHPEFRRSRPSERYSVKGFTPRDEQFSAAKINDFLARYCADRDMRATVRINERR